MPEDSPQEILVVRSEVWSSCPFCEGMPTSSGDFDNLADQANHYLQAHGFRLLHVGQETAWGSDGDAYQATVAVLGSSEILERREIPDISAVIGRLRIEPDEEASD